MWWARLCPLPNPYIEILTLSTSEDCIWRLDIKEVTTVKVVYAGPKPMVFLHEIRIQTTHRAKHNYVKTQQEVAIGKLRREEPKSDDTLILNF